MENQNPSLSHFNKNLPSFFLKIEENQRNQSSGKTSLKFPCPIEGCGKIFQYKSEQEKHMVRHSQERPFTCQFPSCGKSFKRQDALRVHIEMHNESFHSRCPFTGCLSQFKTKTGLEKHVWQHFSAQQQLMRRLQESQYVFFPNVSTELWLQTLRLQAKNNLLQNNKHLLNLFISSQEDPQNEIFVTTAKRFFDLESTDQHRKLICTESEKTIPVPTQNLQEAQVKTPEEQQNPSFDETGLAELFLNHLNQENQNLRRILAFQMTKADVSQD